MTRERIEKILKQVESRRLSSRRAFEKLKNLPYETFSFARVDHHRPLRKGFPEAVYAPGKTLPQLEKILRSVKDSGQNLIVTRLEKKNYEALRKKIPGLRYSRGARIAYFSRSVKRRSAARLSGTARLARRQPAVNGILPSPVAVLTGGTGDIPVAEEAAISLSLMGCEPVRIYDCGVAGLHRLLDEVPRLEKVRAIICVAGMEGALASVVSGLVDKPVIAVPTSVGYGASFKGIAPLLTMLNSCAPGVAVVNIDNGFGAACFAVTVVSKK
ncbi:MAG: nickel pincer cofactor biosynthesis protein LarB [Candidatus Omnitrophica bacterium]|nr:nickel pincer cofactor biosynthesis protein LarB [Candidatus Omnitrophota bacterium]